MAKNKFFVFFAASVSAGMLFPAQAFAQYTGELGQVGVLFDGSDKSLVFSNATVTVSGSQSAAVSIGSVEENSSNNAEISLYSTSLKSAGNFGINVVTRGDVSIYADSSSYISDGVSVNNANRIKMSSYARVGESADDWDYAAQTGIILNAAKSVEFNNYSYIRASVTSLHMTAGGEGAGTLKFYNSSYFTDEATDDWLGGEIRTLTRETAVYFGGNSGSSARLEAVNEGYIGNYYNPVILNRAGQPSRRDGGEGGAAVHIDAAVNSGYFINAGAIESSVASIRNYGSNVTIDLRENSGIAGEIEIAGDSNNTLKLNAVHHTIYDGDYANGSFGNVLMGNSGGDVSLYNKLELSLEYAPDYETVWDTSNGCISTSGRVDIENVILLLDLENASLDVGDVFTIIEAGQGIAGSFYGLEPTETVAGEYGDNLLTVKFSQGGYLFLLIYNEYEDGDTAITNRIDIEVLSVAIPEPASCAAIAGLLAVALAAYSRRRG